MFITKGRATGLFTGIHFDWEISAHTWEEPEIYQIQTQNQANLSDWPEETLRKYPIKMNQTTVRAELSFWVNPCLSTHTVLFPLNKDYFFHYFPFFSWNSFLQSQTARALSLTTGLVAKIQSSHCSYLTSASDWDPKPCFKPLQAETTHPRSECNAQHLLVCPSLKEEPVCVVILTFQFPEQPLKMKL